MTANAFVEDRRICLERAYTKPVDPDALFATILKWLTKRAGNCTGGSLPFAVMGKRRS